MLAMTRITGIGGTPAQGFRRLGVEHTPDDAADAALHGQLGHSLQCVWPAVDPSTTVHCCCKGIRVVLQLPRRLRSTA